MKAREGAQRAKPEDRKPKTEDRICSTSPKHLLKYHLSRSYICSRALEQILHKICPVAPKRNSEEDRSTNQSEQGDPAMAPASDPVKARDAARRPKTESSGEPEDRSEKWETRKPKTEGRKPNPARWIQAPAGLVFWILSSFGVPGLHRITTGAGIVGLQLVLWPGLST